MSEWNKDDRSVLEVIDWPGKHAYIVWWRHESCSKPFAVQYRGSGHYYRTLEGALGYIEGKFGEIFEEENIMEQLHNAEVFHNDKDALKSMGRA